MLNKLRSLPVKMSILTLVFIGFLSACVSDPRKAEVKIVKKAPAVKTTVYSDAIRNMGLMNEIYDTFSLKIMTNDISDNTGTSGASKYEIPRDITEMVRSALNAVGGNVVYIPYDPAFMQNNMALGYSKFANKVVPDVIVSGGITEFDRSLSKSGDSLNADISATVKGLKTGFNAEDSNSASTSRVTLDFNLVDFQTFTGIPRMQAINSIEVSKAQKKKSFGFSIVGATFGAQGNITKIQGRHAAVRLLVELSMIQLIGRIQQLPYWNLIPGTKQDSVVMDQIIDSFYAMNEEEKIAKMQQYLFLNGFNLQLDGKMSNETTAALNALAAKKGLQNVGINEKTYIALFESIPIDRKTKHRRNVMNQKLADAAAKLEAELASKVEAANVAQQRAQNSQSANAAEEARIAAYAVAQATALADQRAAMAEKLKAKKVTVKKVEPAQDSGNLKLWTDKGTYKIGETMTINFSVDKPMFVRLMIVNSKNEVSTLFPNPMQSDNYLKPGIVYSIPPASAEFTLDIGAPAGTDFVKGVASQNPIPAGAIHFNGLDFNAEKMKSFPIRTSVPIVINP